MTIRTLATIAALVVSATGHAKSRDELAGSKPNVLVILCDDLGYGDLGCFGHPVMRTPNLDRLASEGVRLTSCYSASPVCSPSRAGLMTGRTPSRAGVYDWIPDGHVAYLPTSEFTIPELLKQAGYDTCHAGKWHLNGKFNSDEQPQPGDHGFDHWFSTQNNARPTHENPTNFVRNGQEVGPLEGFSCQLVADEAIGWLEGRSDESPFFLYVCFHEPHERIASPADLTATYLDDEGSQARNEKQAEFFANVTNMDAAVGRLLAALKDRGVEDETLVVFTSDNGPETLSRSDHCYGSTGSLRGRKLWLYEGGIRVPGIVRWPGVLPAGEVNDVPVCSLDLLPTLCELAGVAPPADRPLDGTSLVPLFAGERFAREKPLAWDYFNSLGDPKAVMRIDDYVVLGHRIAPDAETNHTRENVSPRTMEVIKAAQLGEFEMYDLRTDRAQTNDLATRQRDRLERYSRLLVDRHREVRDEGPVWKFPAKEGDAK
ncbi:MAG: sulfatase-like hydrolase/transferase [Planctomycetaceae bacterium]